MTQQINLIERSLLPQREWFNGRIIVATLCIGTLALATHWWLERSAMQQLMAGAAAQASAQGADAAASAPADEISILLNEQQARLARAEQLMAAVGTLDQLPRDNARRLRDLVAALPESVWLQEVSFEGAHGVRIVGGATQPTALAELAERLNQTPGFQGLPLHIFALDTRERENTAASTSPLDGAPVAAPRVLPPRYGFVLASGEFDAAASPRGGL